jgi:putative spermidine/putrescine transport system substrate-binding protein
MTLGRRALLGAAAGLAAPFLLRGAPAVAAGTVVVASSGGDYEAALVRNIDERLMKPRSYAVTHRNETQQQRMDALMGVPATPHGEVDVVCLNDIDMYIASLTDSFQPLTATDVPNLPRMLPALRSPYAIAQGRSAMVVLYNPAKVNPAPRAFADIWSPRLRGHIGFSSTSFPYVIAAATLAAGGTMRNLGPGQAKLTELKLLAPRIFATDEALGAAMQSGDVWIAPMWRSQGYAWRQQGAPVASMVPREGAIPVAFCAAVPRNAPDRAGGFAYLNAMLDQRAQVAFAGEIGFLPTVRNVSLTRMLSRRIGFTRGENEVLRSPDYDTMARNFRALRDFWTSTFGG